MKTLILTLLTALAATELSHAQKHSVEAATKICDADPSRVATLSVGFVAGLSKINIENVIKEIKQHNPDTVIEDRWTYSRFERRVDLRIRGECRLALKAWRDVRSIYVMPVFSKEIDSE